MRIHNEIKGDNGGLPSPAGQGKILAKRTKKTAGLNASPLRKKLSLGQVLFLLASRVLGFHGQRFLADALAQVSELGPANLALPLHDHLVDAR